LFRLLKQIIGRLSADADCQMADTDYRQTGPDTNYRPIISAPLVEMCTFYTLNLLSWFKVAVIYIMAIIIVISDCKKIIITMFMHLIISWHIMPLISGSIVCILALRHLIQ